MTEGQGKSKSDTSFSQEPNGDGFVTIPKTSRSRAVLIPCAQGSRRC